MKEQIKEYLEKYKITSKEQLEKHIEELTRNTHPNDNIIFILDSVLCDEELLSNLFSLKNKTNRECMNRLIEEELERQGEYWVINNTGSILNSGAPYYNHTVGKNIKKEPSGKIGIEEITKIITDERGKKENSGKIDYSEIDFDILDLMATRFNANKHKYPAGNMLRPIEEKELLFALLRHLKKMIQPIETDTETFEEHLAAILCNAQMVYQQRKLNKN